MLLRKLVDFEQAGADRLPAGYAALPVRWQYDLDDECWHRRTGVGDSPAIIVAPTVVRGVKIAPALGADLASYALGVDDGTRPDRTRLYHQAFRTLLKSAVDAGVSELKDLYDWLPDIKPPAAMLPNDRVVFSRGSVLLTDLDAVKAFWADRINEGYLSEYVRDCLCCGRRRRIVNLMPEWIVGVPEAQSGRCTLVTANAESAERYGKTQSLSACLCYDCAADSVRGLNKIIKEHSVVVGTLVVACWGCPEMPFAEALTAPTPETVVKLRNTVWGDEECCLFVLSASAARASPRYFETVSARELANRLGRWLKHQGPVPVPVTDVWYDDAEGKRRHRLGMLSLLAANESGASAPISEMQAVVMSVLTGAPPSWYLRDASRQEFIRTFAAMEYEFPGPLFVVATAVMQLSEGDQTMQIANSPAYRSGVLLAHLELIQRAAVPNINRSLADTVLRSAQANPAAVLGQALGDARVHLTKLEKMNQADRHKDAFEECLAGLVIPERLTPIEYGWFCQGYYSVALARINRRRAAAAARAADEEDTVPEEE
jgi:CRISPR-associated protein Csd1